MADLKAKLRNTGTLMAKQTVAGGGKGATDWAHLKDKPFETLGDDFTVDNGELQIAEGVIPAISATATLSTGTEVGSVTVNGVTTTFYAPESSSVEIDNKSLIEVDGVIQEAVPIYTENGTREYTLNSASAGYQDFYTKYFNGDYGEYLYNNGRIRNTNYTVFFRFNIEVDGEIIETVDTYGTAEYSGSGVDWMSFSFTDSSPCKRDYNFTVFRLAASNTGDIQNYGSVYCDSSSSHTYKLVSLSVEELQDSQFDSTNVTYHINGGIVYHKLPSEYLNIDNDTIKVNSDGNIYADVQGSTLEIDNKSIVLDSDGKVSEAVPVYTEHIDEVRQVTRAASIVRGIIWTNKFYANPYADYTNPVDITIRYWYTGIYDSESGETITGQWNAVDLTDTSAIYTDNAGKRWTIYTEVEESDHPILNYIAFNCLDELENGYYRFYFEIPAMSDPAMSGEWYANREQQGYENKWATHGYWEVIYDIVDYPNVDEIYFKYLIQQGYSTYEQVDVVANNVDINQPITVTDTKNVEWKITFTRTDNPHNPNAMLITLEALSDLPADFRDLEFMDIDDSYGNIFLKFQARVIDTVIHQLPAEYVPIDNDTIQNVNGKLVAQSGSGVSNVEYEDLTGGQGQQIGTLRVTNRQGVAETYVYAPSGGGSVEIDNKSLITNDQGKVQMAVPLYTETIDEMPAGLQITGWQDIDGVGDDADGSININDTDITLNTNTDAYTVTAKIDSHIYSGSWTAATDQGHSYGGYTWIIPELDANPTCEFYLENIGSGDYNTHIYLNGVNCSNVEWLIITPNNAGDVIENYRDEGIFNMNCSWFYGQQGDTTVHQLPAQYVPIDNDTIINDNGVLKAASGGSQVSVTQTLTSGTAIADVIVDGVTTTLYAPAGGGGSVDIDNKSIIKNANDELQEAVPVYSEYITNTYNCFNNWGTPTTYNGEDTSDCGKYVYETTHADTAKQWKFILNYNYNGNTYQMEGYLNSNTVNSMWASNVNVDLDTGNGHGDVRSISVITQGSGANQIWGARLLLNSPYITPNFLVFPEVPYDDTYTSSTDVITETVHKLPNKYVNIKGTEGVYNGAYYPTLYTDAENVIRGVRLSAGTNMTLGTVSTSDGGKAYTFSCSLKPSPIGGILPTNQGSYGIGNTDVRIDNTHYILQLLGWRSFYNSWGQGNYYLIFNYCNGSYGDQTYSIAGELNVGATIDAVTIDGFETVVDSVSYNSSTDRLEFTLKENIKHNGSVTIYKLGVSATSIQRVNSYWLPLDNNTIKRDSDGNIKTAIPVPPTTDGTYTLQVVVSDGVPTYSWV